MSTNVISKWVILPEIIYFWKVNNCALLGNIPNLFWIFVMLLPFANDCFKKYR